MALTHVKGEWSKRKFLLEPWQQAIVGNLFGWVDSAGLRRYRQAMIAVPKKNGKTPLAAGLALRLFLGEYEPGAELISVASTVKQARLVWDWAKGMIRGCHRLNEKVRMYQHSIVRRDDILANYQPIAAEAAGVHGLNLHGAVVDELHTIPDRDLIDGIETCTASRREPLVIFITTAGWNRESICYEKWEYALGVGNGLVNDPRFLPAIWALPIDADWRLESSWRMANPNLGKSVKLDYLQRECEKAKLKPAYASAFRQLHCNQWTEQAQAWFAMDDWDAAPPRRTLAELEHQPCLAGLDLSEKRDLTGFVLLFPDNAGGFDVRSWSWIPEANAREREKRDGVPYREWADRGLVELTKGDIIDFDRVEYCVGELWKRYNIVEIGYDRRFATQISTHLKERFGIACVEVPQTFRNLSEPMKLALELSHARKLRHGGNPVLRWQAGNTAAATDKFNEGLVRPVKAKSSGRIDNIVALIMALQRAIVYLQTPVYYAAKPVGTPTQNETAEHKDVSNGA